MLALSAGFFAACYAEREPPPNFRYACDRDGDCLDGQTCVDGLCETPCTNATFADDCTRGELPCLNGVCSSGCEVGGSSCPGAQECVDLGLELGGGNSFLGGGNSDAVVGVCVRECSTSSCPAMNVCIEGFCVQTCMQPEECFAGTTCLGGLCLPDTGGTDGTSAGPLDESSSTLDTITDGESSSSTDPAPTTGAT